MLKTNPLDSKFILTKVWPVRSEDTPLDLAVLLGEPSIVQFLLNNGAKVNTPNIKKRTPLHLAAAKGNIEVAKILLQHKANINAQANLSLTPLLSAIVNGHKDMVELLLQNNADIRLPVTVSDKLTTALQLAESLKNNTKTDPNKVPAYEAIIAALQARGAK